MSGLDALFAAVLMAPDDDLPRLVYADALEEAGDVARAEFIRLQIELARTPGRQDLVAREAALFAVYGETWLAPLKEYGEALSSLSTHGEFRRGFVEVVWMPPEWFVNRAEKLFAKTPCRELRVVRSLRHDFTRLVGCHYIAKLRTLDMSDRHIGDSGASVIACSPLLSEIRVLRLRACNLTDAGACRLAYARFEWPLEELDVGLNDLSSLGLLSLRTRFGHDVVKFEPPPPTD